MGRLDKQGPVLALDAPPREVIPKLGLKKLATKPDGTMTDHAGSHIVRLAETASRGIPAMLNESGLCCFDFDTETGTARGESVRYSLIVALGLLRRTESGAPVEVPVEPILAAVRRYQHGLGVGDTALRLWIDVRRGASDAESTLNDLEQKTNSQPTDDLLGLEVGWWATAAATATAAGLSADKLLSTAIATLRARRSSRSPLFRHQGSGWRAQYPNFATEIYTLLALSDLARLNLFDEAERWATELADYLIELQLEDGAWPWLYQADTGKVVEPYEIYSVHQDAMAPMAFLRLAEATGRTEYVDAALSGVAWCFGQNKLGQSLVDDNGGCINRSIRRASSSKHVNLGGNVLLAGPLRREGRLNIGRVEINRTCRPYHLGWILEAWSGREHLLDAATQGSLR